MLREAEATVGMKMLCQMTVPWTTMSRLRTTAPVRLPCRSEWTLQVSEPPFPRSRPKPHRILQRQLGFGFRIDGPRLRGPTDAEHGPDLGGPTGVLCENRFCSRHEPSSSVSSSSDVLHSHSSTIDIQRLCSRPVRKRIKTNLRMSTFTTWGFTVVHAGFGRDLLAACN